MGNEYLPIKQIAFILNLELILDYDDDIIVIRYAVTESNYAHF